MNSKLFDLKIYLDQPDDSYQVGDTLKGRLTLQAKEEVGIEFLGIRLVLEGLGELNPIKESIASKRLLAGTLFSPNESHQFSFSFPLNGPASYDGSNIKLEWRVETVLELSPKYKRDSRWDSLKSLDVKKIINPKDDLNAYFPIKIMDGASRYQIESTKGHFENNSNYYPFLIALSIFCFISMWFLPFFLVGVAGIVAVGLLVPTILSFVNGYLFDKIDFSLEQENDEGFIVNILFPHNTYFIKSANIFYQIRERAKDQRDSDLKIHDVRKFESPTDQIAEISKNIKVEFSFPQKRLPGSFIMEEISIYWDLHLEVETKFGYLLQYSRRLEVKKIQR